jgi:ribonuclease P protein component
LLKGPKKARFEEIFSGGRRAQGTLLKLCSLPGTGLVGFATSKKIGDRPQRNRARRRVQAAVRGLGNSRCNRLDYVLIISQETANAPFERIGEEVRSLFQKAVEKWELELGSS